MSAVGRSDGKHRARQPASPPREQRSVAALAEEVERLLREGEVPPLDRFLLQRWIIAPACAARETGVVDGRLPSTTLTESEEPHDSPGGLSLGAFQLSRHAAYYNEPPHRHDRSSWNAETAAAALRFTRDAANQRNAEGEEDENGKMQSRRQPVKPDTRRLQRARSQDRGPLSVEYQRLAELHAILLRYCGALQELLQAVKDRERVWTALQWWSRHMLRETSFEPAPLPLSSSTAADPLRRQDEWNRDGRRDDDAVYEAYSTDDEVERDSGRPAAVRGTLQSLGLPPRSRHQRGNSAPPPPCRTGAGSVPTVNGGPRQQRAVLVRRPSSAHPKPETAGRSSGSGPFSVMALFAGSPYLTPTSRGAGDRPVLPRARRTGSAPTTPSHTTTATTTTTPRTDVVVATSERTRYRPTTLSAPLPRRPSKERERPVSALHGAVPRSLHAPCVLYYLFHLQRTGVAVVQKLRAWRKHLTNAFPFVVERTNYSLEMLLQAVRLSEDAALRYALGRPLLSSGPQSGGGGGAGGTAHRDHSHTPDEKQTRSAYVRSTSSSPNRAVNYSVGSHYSYESDAEEERKRARRVAMSGSAWPEALVAFPLAAAYPRLSAYGLAPPAYLVNAVESAKLGKGSTARASRESVNLSADSMDGVALEKLLIVSFKPTQPEGGVGVGHGKASEEGNALADAKEKRRVGVAAEHSASSSPSSAVAAAAPPTAAAAEQWLSKEVARQLRCCRACMSAAVGHEENSPTRSCRPVLWLAATKPLLRRELSHKFAALVERDGQAAQLWGQWVADVDTWHRHLEEASSSMDVDR